MLSIYKQHFAEKIAKHIDLSLEEILALIEIPPENIPGDFAFPCFQLSKLLKKSPQQIAEDVMNKLFVDSDKISLIENFTTQGGYLNVYINKLEFITSFFTHKVPVPKSQFSSKILIEYMSANPNKPLHI
jgi:arginyl-tRNA synthetase